MHLVDFLVLRFRWSPPVLLFVMRNSRSLSQSKKCMEELKVAKESEALLKEQVALYSSKMHRIQDTLKQSNAAFTEFRKVRLHRRLRPLFVLLRAVSNSSVCASNFG